MNIVISYDQPTGTLPAGFTSVVSAVAAFYQSQFTDNITFNLHVGYGEAHGSTLGPGALGQSSWFLNSFGYTAIRNALVADAKTGDDSTGLGNVPVSDPIGGTHTYWLAQVQQKALGLLPNSSVVDTWVGFSNTFAFDYDRSDGITAGQYDFYGTVAHEIAEVMGKNLLVGETIGTTTNSYVPSDLFHYSSPGARDFSGTTRGYFSINGGTTNLNNFNTNPGGDFGDWKSSAGNDSWRAFSNSGVVNAVTETDLKFLDVIGFDRIAQSSPLILKFVSTNDFDVNGKADILWTSNGSAVLWMNSGGALTQVQVANAHVGAEWSAVGIGHDHSSNGDIIWSDGSGGNINVWQLNGTALSGAAVLPGHMGAEWQVAGLGDFDGDGNTDLLWESTAGNTNVWSMNGLSLNSAVQGNGQISAESQVVAVGDLFGTGRDAVLWEESGGHLQSWSMNGANVVATANVGQIGAEWHVAGVGHFLNDGPTDIVWVNTNNDVQFWQMTNGVISNFITPAGHVGTEWHLESVNDFIGDGNSDLLWIRSDGATNIWQINGSQVQSSFIPAPTGNTLQFQAAADPSSMQSNATSESPSELGPDAGPLANPIGQHAVEVSSFYPASDQLASLVGPHNDNGANAIWDPSGGQIIGPHSLGGAGPEWHIFG